MLAGFALLIVTRSLVFVPGGTAYILERLGQFERVLGPGLHIMLPFVHRVSGKINIGDQTLDVPPTSCATRDGTPARFEGSVRFRVADPERAYSGVQEFRTALVQLVATEWKRAIEESDRSGAADAVGSAGSPLRTLSAELGLVLISVTPFLRIGDERVRALGTRTTHDRAHAVEGTSVFAVAQPATIRFAVASGTIAPGALGVVEADGRQWTARNLSSTEIPRGFRCVVERQEGETLLVRCV